MKYYIVNLVCAVEDSKYAEWDSQCDETFHGPAGQLHNPDDGIWVTSYYRTTENKASDLKYKLFDEYGGI